MNARLSCFGMLTETCTMYLSGNKSQLAYAFSIFFRHVLVTSVNFLQRSRGQFMEITSLKLRPCSHTYCSTNPGTLCPPQICKRGEGSCDHVSGTNVIVKWLLGRGLREREVHLIPLKLVITDMFLN